MSPFHSIFMPEILGLSCPKILVDRKCWSGCSYLSIIDPFFNLGTYPTPSLFQQTTKNPRNDLNDNMLSPLLTFLRKTRKLRAFCQHPQLQQNSQLPCHLWVVKARGASQKGHGALNIESRLTAKTFFGRPSMCSAAEISWQKPKIVHRHRLCKL